MFNSLLLVESEGKLVQSLSQLLLFKIDLETTSSIKAAIKKIQCYRGFDCIVIGSYEEQINEQNAIAQLQAADPQADLILLTDHPTTKSIASTLGQYQLKGIERRTTNLKSIERVVRTVLSKRTRDQASSSAYKRQVAAIFDLISEPIPHASSNGMLKNISLVYHDLMRELGLAQHWEAALAVRVIPFCFSLLPDEDLNVLRSGELARPAFQHVVDSVFGHGMRLTRRLPILNRTELVLLEAMKAVGKFTDSITANYGNVLRFGLIWCLLVNQGVPPSRAVRQISVYNHHIQGRFLKALLALTWDVQQVDVETVDVQHLKPGMVVLENIELVHSFPLTEGLRIDSGSYLAIRNRIDDIGHRWLRVARHTIASDLIN